MGSQSWRLSSTRIVLLRNVPIGKQRGKTGTYGRSMCTGKREGGDKGE